MVSFIDIPESELSQQHSVHPILDVIQTIKAANKVDNRTLFVVKLQTADYQTLFEMEKMLSSLESNGTAPVFIHKADSFNFSKSREQQIPRKQILFLHSAQQNYNTLKYFFAPSIKTNNVSGSNTTQSNLNLTPSTIGLKLSDLKFINNVSCFSDQYQFLDSLSFVYADGNTTVDAEKLNLATRCNLTVIFQPMQLDQKLLQQSYNFIIVSELPPDVTTDGCFYLSYTSGSDYQPGTVILLLGFQFSE